MPFLIYGIVGVCSGLLMLIMPETRGHLLSQTIEETVQSLGYVSIDYIFILDVSSFQLFVNCQHWQYLSFLCFNLGTTVLCMWYWELIIKLLMRILTSNVWMIVIYDKGNSHFQLCHFCVGGYLRKTPLYLYHFTRGNFDWF